MYIAIFIVATAISGTLASNRLRLSFPKHFFVSVFEWFGELGLFCMRLLRACLAPPYEFRELFRQCDEIGSKSLPLVALAGAATGVVLSLQTHDSLIPCPSSYLRSGSESPGLVGPVKSESLWDL